MNGTILAGTSRVLALAILLVATACDPGAGEPSPSAPGAAVATPTPKPTPEPTPEPTLDRLARAAAVLEQCADAVEPGGELVALTLGASSSGFDTERLEGPRHCEPFTITLLNTKGSAEHMVAMEPIDEIGVQLFEGELIGRGETITYEIPPLPAGEYRFVCNPHRQFMQGTLTVSPGS